MSALMIITNQLKIYFKLGTLQLCKNLIRSVGQPNFPPFESFPVSHRVTYKVRYLSSSMHKIKMQNYTVLRGEDQGVRR